MYKQLENKDFLNNQNYVSNSDVKVSLLFDYYFKREIGLFSLNIINIILKFILGNIVKYFYKKNNSWVNYLILHFLLIIIISPFIMISIYLYIMIYLYLSYFILNLIADISFSKVHILAIRRKPENKYFNFSYINCLIENVDFSNKIFKNNINIFLKSIFYTILANLIGYGIYLIYLNFIHA